MRVFLLNSHPKHFTNTEILEKIESGENDHAEPSHTNTTRKHNKKVKQIIS